MKRLLVLCIVCISWLGCDMSFDVLGSEPPHSYEYGINVKVIHSETLTPLDSARCYTSISDTFFTNIAGEASITFTSIYSGKKQGSLYVSKEQMQDTTRRTLFYPWPYTDSILVKLKPI